MNVIFLFLLFYLQLDLREVHLVLCHPKPWSNNPTYYKSVTYCKQRHNCSCKKYFDLFHFYAQKTEYYENIKKFCGVKHILL